MTQTSSPTSGFTLIELLVVMAILALLSAAAVSNLSRRPDGLARREVSAKLRLALERARDRAMASGQTTSVRFDDVAPDASLRRVDAARRTWPFVRFYPDGSSDGGTIVAAGRPVAQISWITGSARHVG